MISASPERSSVVARALACVYAVLKLAWALTAGAEPEPTYWFPLTIPGGNPVGAGILEETLVSIMPRIVKAMGQSRRWMRTSSGSAQVTVEHGESGA